MQATTCGIGDLAAYLGGCWELERHLADEASGAMLRFAGAARWWPDGAGELSYEERGVLRRPDGADAAWRRLRFVLVARGCASVRDADGRAVHELDLTRGRWRTVFSCGADRYVGLFVVRDDDQLLVRWTVRGPAKRYTSTSRYRRR